MLSQLKFSDELVLRFSADTKQNFVCTGLLYRPTLMKYPSGTSISYIKLSACTSYKQFRYALSYLAFVLPGCVLWMNSNPSWSSDVISGNSWLIRVIQSIRDTGMALFLFPPTSLRERTRPKEGWKLLKGSNLWNYSLLNIFLFFKDLFKFLEVSKKRLFFGVPRLFKSLE